MAAAQRVSIETYGVDGAAEQYTVESKDLAPLKEFSSH